MDSISVGMSVMFKFPAHTPVLEVRGTRQAGEGPERPLRSPERAVEEAAAQGGRADPGNVGW